MLQPGQEPPPTGEITQVRWFGSYNHETGLYEVSALINGEYGIKGSFDVTKTTWLQLTGQADPAQTVKPAEGGEQTEPQNQGNQGLVDHSAKHRK